MTKHNNYIGKAPFPLKVIGEVKEIKVVSSTQGQQVNKPKRKY